MLLGRPEEKLYLVQFTCGCAVVVAHGRIIRRTRGFTLVCEHVATK